jgi:hypothetical protein
MYSLAQRHTSAAKGSDAVNMTKLYQTKHPTFSAGTTYAMA